MAQAADFVAGKIDKPSLPSLRLQKGKVHAQDVVHGDQGLSVEEARKAMIEAGDAPRGVAAEGEGPKRGRGSFTQTTTPKSDGRTAPAPNPRRLRPTKARLTAINPDGTDGESAILSADTAQELNNSIQLAHTQAQKAGYPIRVELMDNDGHVLDMNGNPIIEEAAPVTPEPAAVVVPQPTVTAEPAPAPAPAPVTIEPERYVDDSGRFSVEIRQEGNEWVGEITYTKGGGTEVFRASKRRELMMKMAVGKANASLKIRELNRRQNYGIDLDVDYILPNYMTQEAYDAMPEDGQRAMIDTLATAASQAFKELHPEYYAIPDNSTKILRFLANHRNPGPLPVTLRNLEYAYEEVREDLTPRPSVAPAPAPAPAAPAPAPVSVSPAPAAATTTGDSQVVAPVAAPAPAAVVAPAPAPAPRKRGSTGLQPSQSSLANNELEETQGEGQKPKEPSVADLRKMSEIGKPVSADLKRAYQASLRPKRQF